MATLEVRTGVALLAGPDFDMGFDIDIDAGFDIDIDAGFDGAASADTAVPTSACSRCSRTAANRAARFLAVFVEAFGATETGAGDSPAAAGADRDAGVAGTVGEAARAAGVAAFGVAVVDTFDARLIAASTRLPTSDDVRSGVEDGSSGTESGTGSSKRVGTTIEDGWPRTASLVSSGRKASGRPRWAATAPALRPTTSPMVST
jgi:hypothetical protein